MLLPNKLFSYNQSVLPKLPILLRCLNSPKTTKELYQDVRNKISSPLEFIDALDCLYALNRIDIDEYGRIYKC